MKKAATKITSAQVWNALRMRYPENAYALLGEVRDATGFTSAHPRSADAIVMSLWPSRGLELMGAEIKVARSDWIKERDEPAKAEAIARFCDRWWLAVSDAEIVKAGELPPTWGLLVLTGKGLVAKVEAPKLTPEPITRGFLGALLRAAQGQLTPEAETARVRSEAEAAGYARGLKVADENGDYEHKRLKECVLDFEKASGISLEHRWEAGEMGRAVKGILKDGLLGLRQRVDEFEGASGVKIDDWSAGDVGAAVKLLLEERNPGHFRRCLENLSRVLDDAKKNVQAVLEPEKASVAP